MAAYGRTGLLFKSTVTLLAVVLFLTSVHTADSKRRQDAIKCGGLAEIRGIQIREILETLKTQKKLRGMTNEEIKKALVRVKGVGPKMVACVMFHLEREELPVSTHVQPGNSAVKSGDSGQATGQHMLRARGLQEIGAVGSPGPSPAPYDYYYDYNSTDGGASAPTPDGYDYDYNSSQAEAPGPDDGGYNFYYYWEGYEGPGAAPSPAEVEGPSPPTPYGYDDDYNSSAEAPGPDVDYYYPYTGDYDVPGAAPTPEGYGDDGGYYDYNGTVGAFAPTPDGYEYDYNSSEAYAPTPPVDYYYGYDVPAAAPGPNLDYGSGPESSAGSPPPAVAAAPAPCPHSNEDDYNPNDPNCQRTSPAPPTPPAPPAPPSSPPPTPYPQTSAPPSTGGPSIAPPSACPPSPDSCAFSFKGYDGTIPTFQLQGEQGDNDIAKNLQIIFDGKRTDVAAANSGPSTFVCPDGPSPDATAGYNQFYLTQSVLKSKSWPSSGYGSFVGHYIKLSVTNAQFQAGASAMNIYPGDNNTEYPEESRCVLFKVET